MDAAYVFAVRFRLAPDDCSLRPDEFETVVEYPAPEPGTGGWLFFRDALWRGAVGDERHVASLASEWLSVPVVEVDFRELRTDEAYLEALRTEIAADLDAFNADDAAEVLTKYLGSSIHVREG